eukprot:11601439-Ditylum_brightwellii.AAC.1
MQKDMEESIKKPVTSVIVESHKYLTEAMEKMKEYNKSDIDQVNENNRRYFEHMAEKQNDTNSQIAVLMTMLQNQQQNQEQHHN